MTCENFEKWDYNQARSEFEKLLTHWLLQNNLHLLTHLFSHVNHLQNLLLNNRTNLFLELWHLLKNNLGAIDLKIVYGHYLDHKDKPELTRIILEGEHAPQSTQDKDLGDALIQNYEGHFRPTWKVQEWRPKSGHFVGIVKIANSPILVMATLYQFLPLQRALLQALFDGISNGVES